MLKIIRRVLRLSGDLSKRIWASFVCGFLESMFGLLPICAVFFVLSQLQSGLGITGQTWGIVLGLIIGVVIGVFVKPDIPIIVQPYLPIMVVAALDALLGAARAYFERSFSDRVFVISFLANVVTATLLVFLG